MRRAVLVYNPKSGRQVSRRLLPAVVRELEAGGFEVEPAPTRGPGDATLLARRAADGGAEVVFAMGGDGTAREVASGLLGTETALGLLPAGTANVLALTFGLPCEARAAARVLPRCRPQAIDVGLAGDEPFLMMASCGFDAAAIARQNPVLKKLLGKAGVALSGLGRLFTYSYPEIELSRRGETARAAFVAVSNVPYYGGPYLMAPEADFRDRRLDLVLFHGRGPMATAGFVMDLMRGRQTKRPDVEVERVREVEILGPPEAPVQIDGDLLAAPRPLVVSIAPERLRVLLPPEVGASDSDTIE